MPVVVADDESRRGLFGRPWRRDGEGTRSRQEARLGLQPLTDYAGTSFTIGRPSLRKDVIDDVIRFDAERVLNDLGGLFTVVTVF